MKTGLPLAAAGALCTLLLSRVMQWEVDAEDTTRGWGLQRRPSMKGNRCAMAEGKLTVGHVDVLALTTVKPIWIVFHDELYLGHQYQKRPRGQPHSRSCPTCSCVVVTAGHEDCWRSHFRGV
jgi:hypothetical protein